MVTTLYNPIVKEEGKKEGKIEAIFELLEEYGDLSAALKARIQSETEMETIKRWHKSAAKVSSIDEFVFKMNN